MRPDNKIHITLNQLFGGLILALLALLLAIVGVAVLASAASAAGPGVAIGTPDGTGEVRLAARPGRIYTGSVLVSNQGDQAAAISVYPADARTASNGGSDYELASETRDAAGAWIWVNTTGAELAPGEGVRVGYTIRVPSTVQPGQYLAGIAAQVVGGSSEGSFSLSTSLRGIVPVRIDVGSPDQWTSHLTVGPSAYVDRSSWEYVRLALGNDGACHITGVSGRVVIRDAATGAEVYRAPLRLGEVIAGTSASPTVFIPRLAPGSYRARVIARYDGQRATGVTAVSVR